MPRKIRELLRDYRRAGFIVHAEKGKGSHRKITHPLLPGALTLAGHEGDDADHYQERDLRNALRDLEKVRKQRP